MQNDGTDPAPVARASDASVSPRGGRAVPRRADHGELLNFERPPGV